MQGTKDFNKSSKYAFILKVLLDNSDSKCYNSSKYLIKMRIYDILLNRGVEWKYKDQDI